MTHEHASPASFVHLHLHSEYSLLDGGNRVDRLVERVKALGMDAVAVTDHGNLFGAVAFYQAAKAAGVRPILGVEAYVAPGDRRDRTHTGVADGGYHLVLLAETIEGWRNLVRLCSEAYLTGFYYKPRIDRAILAERSSGLIAINGHLGSEIGEHLLAFDRTRDDQHWRKAVESARWHAAAFAPGATGPRFYIELQHHVPEQNAINPHLIRLAGELGLPLVADNDAHFLRAEDHDAHDTLVCISLQKAKSDPARLRYSTELYVKSPAQMREIFEGTYGDAGRAACDATASIAARCRVDLPLHVNHAPAVRVTIPDAARLPRPEDAAFGGDADAWHRSYCAAFEVRPLREGADDAAVLAAARSECDRALRLLAEAGFRWRYGPASESTAAMRARLDRELTILCDKGIAAYFLIVWDFVNWGRDHGVPALARGSGVGTMVGYVLGLSNACPVRYGLLFERFTDPDRSEFPDIDIDMDQDGRARVIDHVRRKYGHVAQIITFGTLKARAAVRDAARVLEMPLADADRLAKLIPEQVGVTIDRALEQEPELRAAVERDDRARRVIDNARTLEGQARHASVHAAGVIVATTPLDEIVPLYKQPGAADHEIVTQWDGPTCEKMGLLKMDFLGLRTISVVERCKRLIRDALPEAARWRAVGRAEGDGPHPLDLDRLGFNDPRVFELFRRADTTGVFQFESAGMRRLLVEMRPDRLEDLIAANALFRPGPMDLIPDYTRRKVGAEAVPRVHPIVDRHTAETYGVMVYQEQVMQIVHELGGIPLRSAYSLIKAISKKQTRKIDEQRPVFIAGATRHGLQPSAAADLFDLILKFAGYGFNKSHSTGYAIIAYQTAYLKTYFPAQYMAAFLTYESAAGKASDWIPYLEDCRATRSIDPETGRVVRSGVEVRPPDINLSRAEFAVVFDHGDPADAHHGHLRFGMGAVKHVGERAVDAIIAERDSTDPARPAQPSGPYRSLHEFCERVSARSPGVLNKAAVESLIKCGAFDALHGRGRRAALLASVDQALSAGAARAADRAAGQGSLFGVGDAGPAAPVVEPPLAPATAWTESETLAHERDVLGFYVSSHPLEAWAAWAGVFSTATTESSRGLPQDARVVLSGLVQSVRTIVTKSGKSAGQKMAVVTVEDRQGVIEGVLFTEAYAQFTDLCRADRMVFILGRVDHARGSPQVIVDRVVPIEGVPLLPGRVRLLVNADRLGDRAEAVLAELGGRLAGRSPPINGNGRAGGTTNGYGANGHGANDHGANGLAASSQTVSSHTSSSQGPDRTEGDDLADRLGGPVYFPLELVVETGAGRVLLEADRSVRVAPSPALVGEVGSLLGEASVRVVGGVSVDLRKDRPRGPRSRDDRGPTRGRG